MLLKVPLAVHLQGNPLFTHKGTVGIVSAEFPTFRPYINGGHEALGLELKKLGLDHRETTSHHKNDEKVYFVYNPTREQVIDLGRKFGQDGVIYSDNGHHQFIHTNGHEYGMHHDTIHPHIQYSDSPPERSHTALPEGGYFTCNFDFSRSLNDAHDMEVKKCEIELPSSLAYRSFKHPHQYPWHDKATTNYLGKSDCSTTTYAKYALPFGKINAGAKTDLLHYSYWNKLAEAEHLAQEHGFRVNTGGEGFQPFDFANKNYQNGHIWTSKAIPDVNGDLQDTQYARTWRILHELAHALTLRQINAKYGEGRRVGKLGQELTLNDALRAVEWEWMALQKQYELSHKLGITLEPDLFNKEKNTIMHDAVHRIATGRSIDPSEQGFMPFSHFVPLSTALNIVKETAFQKGIRSSNRL